MSRFQVTTTLKGCYTKEAMAGPGSKWTAGDEGPAKGNKL